MSRFLPRPSRLLGQASALACAALLAFNPPASAQPTVSADPSASAPSPTSAAATAPATQAPTEIRVTGYTPWAWDPPTRARRAALQTFMDSMTDPVSGKPWREVVKISPDNPLSFPGFSLKILNFSAGTGEEVIVTSDGITQFYQYRDQRFFMPLNPLIWQVRTDAAGKPVRLADGTWDYVPGPDEGRVLLWPSWRSIPPVYRSMIEWRGDIYGVPMSNSANGLMFRRDAFARAGLDPARPPATWDDVFAASLRISAASTPAAPVFGLQLNNSVVESILLGQGGDFARVETDAAGRTRWVSTVDSPEMEATLRYLRKLTLTRWIIDPAGAPFIVWEPDRDTPLPIEHSTLGAGRWDGDPLSGRGSVVFASRAYGPSEIRQGVAMNQLGGQTGGNQKWYSLFTQASPRLGMAMNTPETLGTFSAAIDGSLLGFGPAPAGPRGAGVQAQGQIAGLNYELANDPAKARLAWAVVGFLASEDYRGRLVRSYVREGAGIAETLPPALLAQHGYETLAESIPPALQDYWNTLDSVVRPVVPAKNFQAITQQYLGPLYREATLNASFDYRTALADARRQIQARLDFAAGDYSGVPHRGLIIAGMVFIVVAVLVASCYAIKAMLAKAAANRAVGTLPPNPHLQNLAWLLMAPALLLISIFAYLPIFKALPIAFQDYHVTGASVWVGSANFVEMFSNPATWAALLKTVYYMTLSIGIGFLAPVVLAILMSEIRSCRYFMRTVYYLPAVVAGIVMLLLWQRFFEATPTGMVNRLYLGLADLWNHLVPASLEVSAQPVDWLRHPVWGIPCVVFVGIWGGMGPGMLIYLAALKSIPEDIYEAAEIDGAGWWARITNITLAYLRPLLVINLIGAVIGAFQASGNILALAGNFPATYTFAVHLWFETFGLGNFGVGTALSWLMAAILMGFTLWQLRILRSVEFRRAQADD